MKRFFRSIIACICGLTIVFLSAVPPAFARDGVIGGVVDGVQSFTEWGVNNLNNFWKIIFGPDFNSASEEELKAAYDAYVATLPATGYDSSGGLRWSPSPAYMYLSSRYSSDDSKGCPGCSHYPGDKITVSSFVYDFDCSSNSVRLSPVSGSNSIGTSYRVWFYYKGSVPVQGWYTRLSTPTVSGHFVDKDDIRHSYDANYSSTKSVYYDIGASITASHMEASFVDKNAKFVFAQGLPPVYEITPDTALSADTYNINTRPTSITGGNYGIVGDNGQITKVEDNSTIVNETNNTYYNPATGQTVPITGWSYDYSDRSYKVTLESGDTATITYGDEYITIKEGDTIYNVYYLIDGTGSENPPAACEHDWQKGEATVPTCTIPGKASYVCSKCQQTKTETLPALGHNWQVKQTVTTQYDEEGNLTQQGYTIFECSRCHEQYKSSDGTVPPGGGSGTDPGGEEGETTIGGLIEKLLSGVGSIVGGIIKGLLSLLTKAVEALAGLAELFTTFVGSLVELWGGFTSFLSAVFPFLPEEFVIIIELGLILMIAAAVFRKFIS